MYKRYIGLAISVNWRKDSYLIIRIVTFSLAVLGWLFAGTFIAAVLVLAWPRWTVVDKISTDQFTIIAKYNPGSAISDGTLSVVIDRPWYRLGDNEFFLTFNMDRRAKLSLLDPNVLLLTTYSNDDDFKMTNYIFNLYKLPKGKTKFYREQRIKHHALSTIDSGNSFVVKSGKSEYVNDYFLSIEFNFGYEVPLGWDILAVNARNAKARLTKENQVALQIFWQDGSSTDSVCIDLPDIVTKFISPCQDSLHSNQNNIQSL